jgi:hypothetical protein
MVRARAFVAVVIATTLTGSAMAGSAGKRALPRPTVKSVIVAGQVARIDASPAAVTVVDRLLFALWTLRNLGLVDVSTIGGGYQFDGIQDGDEPISGAKDKGITWPTIPPTTGSTPVR